MLSKLFGKNKITPAQILVNELETRNIGGSFIDVNIPEYLNNIFVVVTALRDFLNSGTCDEKTRSSAIALIMKLLEFSEKWHSAYNSWLSYYKTTPSYKNSTREAEPYFNYTIQSNFKYIDDITNDIYNLNSIIHNFKLSISNQRSNRNV